MLPIKSKRNLNYKKKAYWFLSIHRIKFKILSIAYEALQEVLTSVA